MLKILIPIEIPDRDFKSRLIVGIKTLRKDEVMLIGRKSITERMAFRVKSNIFYSRGMEDRKTYRLLFAELKNKNTQIFVHDVESGSYFDNKIAFKYRRIDSFLLSYIDNFICWSDFEKNFLIETYKTYESKFITVGNPKFAYPKNKFINLKHSINTNVLINMSMALTSRVSNHRDLIVESQLLNAGAKGFEIRSWKRARALRRKENLELLKSVNFLIKECQDVIFKIRPHPGDDDQTFIKEFCFDTNLINVSNKDSLENDIKNADFILHVHCNTAIDALSFGKVSLCVDFLGIEQVQLPSRVASQIITCKEKLALILKERKTFNHLLDDKLEQCSAFYKTLQHTENENCEQIANLLLQRECAKQISLSIFEKMYLIYYYLKCLIAFLWTSIITFFNSTKSSGVKFPTLENIKKYVAEVEKGEKFKYITLPGGVYLIKKINK